MPPPTQPPPGPPTRTRLETDATATAPPLPVASLLCNAHVPMACDCLGSFVRRCRDRVELVIFDDGSITPDDRDRLTEHLGPHRLISRQQADDTAATALAHRPHLRRYRALGALALKFTDIPMFFPDGFGMVDSDIYITRPFTGLDGRTETGGPGPFVGRFMRDEEDAFCLTAYERGLLAPRGIRLLPRFNSGFFHAGAGLYDPDYADWFVGRVIDRVRAPTYIEQTGYAALAARQRCAYFDSAQVRAPVPLPHAGPGPLPVVLHFMSPYRYLLREADYWANLQAAAIDDPAEPAPLNVRPCPADRLVVALWQAGMRRVRARRGYPGSPPRRL